MAYPKKSYGFRRIVVDGQIFRWRVTSAEWNLADGRRWNSTLTLQGAKSGGQQFVVELFDGPGAKTPHETLTGVYVYVQRKHLAKTPQFVREMIRLALANGWNPDERHAPMRMTLPDDAFVMDDGLLKLKRK